MVATAMSNCFWWFGVTGVCLGWIVARELALRVAIQQFLQARQEWAAEAQRHRERERELIDTYLRKQGVTPLSVQADAVLKLQDAEAAPARSWIDDAMRRDEIKERLEETYPDAAWIDADEAQARWADEWKRLEKRWEEEHTPLRVA